MVHLCDWLNFRENTPDIDEAKLHCDEIAFRIANNIFVFNIFIIPTRLYWKLEFFFRKIYNEYVTNALDGLRVCVSSFKECFLDLRIVIVR